MIEKTQVWTKRTDIFHVN